MKQEEQEKRRKNRGVLTQNKEKTRELTLEQAKHEIYQLIIQGNNYRDISKQAFFIQNLGAKHFSISQISQIKKENEATDSTVIEPAAPKNENLDTQKVVSYLNSGYKLEEIVIQTGLSPKFVLKTFHEFLELKRYSPSLIDELYGIAEEWGMSCNSSEQFKKIFSKALDSWYYLSKLHYNCCYCGGEISLDPNQNPDWAKDMAGGINFLNNNHFHRECDRRY